MLKIKAVDLMRKIRNELEISYAKALPEERTAKIRKELEDTVFGQFFLKRHQRH